MMNMIKTLLKGMVIGVANAIPGVSGGTMMVAMGIYDKLIHAITHLFQQFMESMKVLLPILFGAAVGIVGLSFVITPAFEHFPIQTNLLFIGLIVGGLPMMFQKVKSHTINLGSIIGFLLFFAMVVVMAAMGENQGADADVSFGLINCVKLFFVGIVAAATMVIPGVSGSMMLMLMGYYEVIIATIKEFVEAMAHLDIAGMLQGMGVLIPMAIGAVVGIFAIAKLVEFVFERFPLVAYWSIIGLIVASPIGIILMNLDAFSKINLVSIVTGIVALAVGVIIAKLLGGEEEPAE